MQIYYEDDQACLFDPECYVGKTCLEHSPQVSRPARTSGSSLRRLLKYVYPTYMFLDLTPGNSNLLGGYEWEIHSPWAGASSIQPYAVRLAGRDLRYIQADFNVDSAFGTFVCTDQNDDWLNIYANYDVEQDQLCDTLELNLCKGDGSEESWSYPLSAAEQEVLLRKMETFCRQQTGMSLHDYTQQLRDIESQAPEMQM